LGSLGSPDYVMSTPGAYDISFWYQFPNVTINQRVDTNKYNFTDYEFDYYETLFTESNLISDLARRVYPNTPHIEQTTGIVSGGLINIKNVDHKTYIETLDKYLLYRYRIGFDNDGLLFIKKYANEAKEVFISSFNCFDIKLDYDYSTVRNTINVQRKSSEYGVGSSIGASISDEQSVKQYGVKALNIEVGGFFSDTACVKIAESALFAYKQPRLKAKIGQMEYRKYEIDICKIVTSSNQLDTISYNYNNINLAQYTYNSPSTVSNDNGRTIVVDGVNKIYKCDLLNVRQLEKVILLFDKQFLNNNDKIIIDCYVERFDKAIIKINGQTFENEIDYDIVNNSINQIILTYTNGIKSYTEIEFDFVDQVDATPSNSYMLAIGNITISRNTNKVYEFPINQVTYNIEKGNYYVDIELDTESNTLDRFLATVKNSRDNLSIYLR
jgi:hypothetical protein